MPTKIMTRLLAGTCLTALLTGGALAAEARPFDIPRQDAASALQAYAMQSGRQVLFPYDAVKGRTVPAVQGDFDDEEALAMLASSAGLRITANDGRTVTLVQAPQGGSAADGNAVEALIVTAQKREENIQDVPIAISAFSAEALEAQKIEGGFDLLKAIPNVTFSKNNFTSYNFSIRGVGTKAVSATTDPGVAVAFNNSTIIQNRLFEQEYFDVERVEVLRGPQGTLYGRNATSGVINVISAKPDLSAFEGSIKGEVGNYNTKRVSAMVNVPLVEDRLAIRLAGALTNRDGYDFNTGTNNPVNGRDLWSARLTIGFEPTERLRGNFIWERFEEDDNRSRTGKQLCHRDDGPEQIGDEVVAEGANTLHGPHVRRALFSQGCKPGSLYADEAFGTPNGLSYNFILGLLSLQTSYTTIGYDADGQRRTIIQDTDPYGGLRQSRDLREISSIRDPEYRASSDLLELNVDFDLTPSLLFSSQTAYVEDSVYSIQDYNRFNTVPIFTDTSQLQRSASNTAPSVWAEMAPGGIFCDPQLGCSNKMVGFDLSQAEAKQFSQELRLASSFEGPMNFSLGANYTEFETLIDYYVMFNVLSAMAMMPPFNFQGQPLYGSVFDPSMCHTGGVFNEPVFSAIGDPPNPVPIDDPLSVCPYIDPNPIESIDGEGHNYFRSKNPYELESLAAFGELYWNLTDSLKLTAGLRYTEDRKTFTPVPTQVLLAPGFIGAGVVPKGYPEDPPIIQEWGEWTGRLGLDWQPELTFTDGTMLYAFYSRGYKGGGANPPLPDFATAEALDEWLEVGLITQAQYDLLDVGLGALFPVLELTAVEYGQTFKPEFVNAYEIGMKNTLLNGGMTFNATAFYYDYKDYQISQIRDRTAVNENFDATVWGLELETLFAPSRNLQIVANLGYLDTEIASGEMSIDIMNRTQEDPAYTVVKPWTQLPSNCVIPTAVAEQYLEDFQGITNHFLLCGGIGGLLNLANIIPSDPNFGGADYDVSNYPELNGGAGILADLGGNELPNAPHWTANLGVQYGMDILDGSWRATVRGDLYWQSQSYHRVYNYEPYDKLRGWYNANLSIWIERPDDGLKIELYAKNIFDDTPITDAFLNSDDTGLTTNVFTLDPRLIGLSIRKEF